MDREPQHTPLTVGSVVAGRYTLLRLLGKGGMGVVYEAEHRITRRRAAVKLMHQADAWSAEAVERFVREARVVARIGHPNIVEVLDAGVHENGQPFMALELLGGEPLSDRLERPGGLAPRAALEVCAEVLEGLVAAHALGIVHRDIKPENVFLVGDERGTVRVKILDFGVSKITREGVSGITRRSLTQSGAAIGTLHYMSPEQVVGKDDVDARADLWAVGVMLYRALTGCFPFDGNNMNVVVLAIMTTELRPLRELAPSVPEPIAAFVERALRKPREERFASAREMLDALRALLPLASREAASSVVSSGLAPTPDPLVDMHAATLSAPLAVTWPGSGASGADDAARAGVTAVDAVSSVRGERSRRPQRAAVAAAAVLSVVGVLAALAALRGVTHAPSLIRVARSPSAVSLSTAPAPAHAARPPDADARSTLADAGVVARATAAPARAPGPTLVTPGVRAEANVSRRAPREPTARPPVHEPPAAPTATAPRAPYVGHEVPVVDFGGT